MVILVIFLFFNQNDLSCLSSSDCVKTYEGCCPCNMGGKEIVVNKDYYEKRIKVERERDCKRVLCPAVYLCTEKKPKCKNGECVLE